VKKYLLVLFVISLTISACASKEDAASLVGSWKLTAYGSADSPTPAVENIEADLNFAKDGKLTGNGGCNGLGGNYKVDGDQITFSQITSTLMACDDPQMAQEDVVHKVLTGIASFKIEGNTLTITKDGTVLILTH